MYHKIILFLTLISSSAFANTDIDKSVIADMLGQEKVPVHQIRAYGEDVLPVLAELYKESGTDAERAMIAWVFYRLGWASTEAEQVLIPALDSQHNNLRLQAQWAVARVTRNSEVIRKMIVNMTSDPNPWFRDKAACALASDFIHISPAQRLEILQGLVDGLSSDNPQVRKISLQAIKIQTGQTKGFNPNASLNDRQESIREWKGWLKDFAQNI